MAINPNKLVIAFGMVVVLAFCGVLFDFINPTVKSIFYEDARVYNKTVLPIFQDQKFITELDVYKSMPEYIDRFLVNELAVSSRGVFSTLYSHLSVSINIIAVKLIQFDIAAVFAEFAQAAKSFDWALRYHTLYTFLYFFIFTAVMAIGGGAICRGAALELCCGKKPSISENFRYGKEKFTDFLCAPLVPIVLILIFGSIISLTGFIGNLPWAGEIIMAAMSLFSLLIGLILVLILLGLIGGVHLMLPAISIEKTDFNDAASRAYCYTYSKPWLLGIYGFVAMFYGAICYMIVRFCAFLLLRTTYAFLSFGMFVESRSNVGIDKLRAIWPEPQFFNLTGKAIAVNIDWSEHFSHLLVSLAVLIISGIVCAFLFSFYFCCSTVIYTLCRKAVDKDPVDKINIE